MACQCGAVGSMNAMLQANCMPVEMLPRRSGVLSCNQYIGSPGH
jgi:hypothetical protein